MPAISVTFLSENTARRPGILGEHGLAYWIRAGDSRVLFDTGQGLVLNSNSERLDIDLAKAGAIVLSHGHYDHTGGLDVALARAPRAPVFVHPAAFLPRYSLGHGQARQIGMDSSVLKKLVAENQPLVLTEEPTEIVPGLHATGQIPRETDFEDTGGPFFLDKEGTLPDPIADDQALYFETDGGTVVILGCAHAGVINTLSYIQRLTGNAPIYAVIGGMHLLNASPDRMRKTISALREMDPQWIGPAHCTGPFATAELFMSFPEKRLACHAGAKLRFPRQAT